MTSPKLSVTVLDYNYAHFLPTCLDSILRQTLADIEVIVVNDCSTDDSADIIGRYADDPRVRVIEHAPNRGFTASLIEGASESRGEYITVVSADDWVVADDAFERQVGALEAHPTAGFAVTGFGYWTDEHHLESVRRPFDREGLVAGNDLATALLLGGGIHHSGTVIRRSTYESVGGYDPEFRYAIDIDMWLKLCVVSDVVVDEAHAHAYRQHGDNMTTRMTTISTSIDERLRAIDRYCAATGVSHSTRRRFEREALVEWVRLYSSDRNEKRLAWNVQWLAMTRRPLLATTNRTFATLVMRTVFGDRLYNRARTVARRALSRRRASSGAEPPS